MGRVQRTSLRKSLGCAVLLPHLLRNSTDVSRRISQHGLLLLVRQGHISLIAKRIELRELPTLRTVLLRLPQLLGNSQRQL